MQVAFLYATAVLIWGSTWIAITFQLGPVAEEVSVAYRFGLGSMSLFAYAAISGRRVRIPFESYGYVILMGVLMYSGSYMMLYHATSYVTSGLVAVIFSLIVAVNAFFERIFFRKPLERRMMLASIIGVAGIAILFWPEVSSFDLGDQTITGVVLATIGVTIASLGNMAAIINTSRSLPVIAVNAHAMAWGGVSSIFVALIIGRPINFSFEPSYVMSLLYLAIFGSAIAFGAYLALLRLIGSARAAYTSVLFPIVALIVSTFFEDYRWSVPAVAGVVLIVAGNWLVLTKITKE
jgi:drug/metabolite transporter (DMT)-like permease